MRFPLQFKRRKLLSGFWWTICRVGNICLHRGGKRGVTEVTAKVSERMGWIWRLAAKAADIAAYTGQPNDLGRSWPSLWIFFWGGVFREPASPHMYAFAFLSHDDLPPPCPHVDAPPRSALPSH